MEQLKPRKSLSSMEIDFFVFLVKAFQLPSLMKGGSDLTKIKFKKGLL